MRCAKASVSEQSEDSTAEIHTDRLLHEEDSHLTATTITYTINSQNAEDDDNYYYYQKVAINVV